MTRVIVVGGGLAGLTAARHLARAGIDVQVFERRDTVGGRVRSRHEDGFVLDRGFQVLFTAYPAAKRELDLNALDLREFTPGATIARPGHRTVLADPLRDPGSLTDTLFNRDPTLRDKLRVLSLRREFAERDETELFVGEDRSIREFLADRGFSEPFVERFFAPFYGGITLDRNLSTSAAVFGYTFRMLAEGSIAIPADGMGAIPEQLADTARDQGARIALDTPVETIETPERGAGSIDTATDEVTVETGGETHTADAVVVATDPQSARDLTDVASIPTDARGCVTQYFSLPTYNALDTGRKLLLNAGEDGPNHVAPLSTVAPEYAPDAQTLLSATFLGDPDESDDELATQVERTLAAWYPERRFDDLVHRHTDRIPFAQIAQPPGFYRDTPAVDAPAGSVYLAGDHTRWSSIHATLDSGRAAARAVLDSE
ncbi:NAD(P)/FAD-dependent oxidoreductase [Halococcus saccharolyticus]|uniref:Flavin-containing amine-oxidoreductase n=1 Tax=Halococcus saccharolyticus DSM 5350 TaxID=1227455 RepID=M0MLC0_9EURY|nr:NAD(P)/FAD-dependent oxidoreductase [Halococcus saccharolyticus]EMA45509.1 flavin-containing amine-oxidoreductase [Halococcus saccharolyticus DSM 5350]